MSLTTYTQPVVTWTVTLSIAAILAPAAWQGFVMGGGGNLLEQARQELRWMFNRQSSHIKFVQPLKTMQLTSKYGNRIHPITGVDSFHNGNDYRCQIGDNVVAIADGVVASVGNAGNAGLLVAIDHANGMQSLYMHLSTASVHEGEQVQSGQTIAACGNSGRSTGAHLHLSLKQGGEFIDPTTQGL